MFKLERLSKHFDRITENHYYIPHLEFIGVLNTYSFYHSQVLPVACVTVSVVCVKEKSLC